MIYDIYGNQIGQVSSGLRGKWLAIGDSITVGGNYVPQVAELTGLTVISGGHAAGGRQVGYGAGAANSVLTYLDDISDTPDIITIALGTNDFGKCPIGSIDDDPDAQTEESFTFIGCYKAMIEKLYAKFGLVPTLLMTPFQRNGGANANSAGLTLGDYAEAIKEVGRYYSYPVFDNYTEGGLPVGTLTDTGGNYLYTKDDGLHINAQGSAVIVPKLIHAMELCAQRVVLPCTALSVSGGTWTVAENGSLTVHAAWEPGGCTDVLTWQSTDETIATARGWGHAWCDITGVSAGECEIVATMGARTARKTVTVTAAG